MKKNNRDILRIYREMARIRIFEEEIIKLFRAGEFPGFLHTAIGQEAVAVGACLNLEAEDWITATHRSHGHILAKGLPMKLLLAEIYGKTNGICGGVAGHVHVADLGRCILGGNGVLGQNQPIAVGLGLANKLLGARDLVVSFFGDGTANTGAVHEAMNLAAVWSLPVIFLCERNEFAELSTYSSQFCIQSIAERAKAYGFPGYSVNGEDVEAVLDIMDEVSAMVRSGSGPVLLEVKVIRWRGHYEGDPQDYRDDKRISQDPLEILAQRYPDILTADIRSKITEDAEGEMEEAIEFARAGDYPTPEEAFSPNGMRLREAISR